MLFEAKHKRRLFFGTISLACVLLLGCGSDKESEKPETQSKNRAANCTEPENPYSQGTGHYAGYEWAEERGGACNGNSPSFNEGCEEYKNQEAEYEECESGNH